MKMDLVHDLQSAYRKVLFSMSRPGIVSNLELEAAKVDLDAPCYPGTLLLALMLLDTEVSFKVVSPQEASLTRLLSQLTYARVIKCQEADFIFILADADGQNLEDALGAAKPGILTDPHCSATVIVEADKIASGQRLALSGPGIENEHLVEIKAAGQWLKKREEQIKEYPLGIDMIFLDAGGQVICIPRTTTIEERR